MCSGAGSDSCLVLLSRLPAWIALGKKGWSVLYSDFLEDTWNVGKI